MTHMNRQSFFRHSPVQEIRYGSSVSTYTSVRPKYFIAPPLVTLLSQSL